MEIELRGFATHVNVTQGGDLSPWNPLKSFYFDDSLAENELHFKIKQYLDEHPLDSDYEELVIRCDDEKQYNGILDALFTYSADKFKISAVTNNDMEIVVERDPREGYRKFDEANLVKDRVDVSDETK